MDQVHPPPDAELRQNGLGVLSVLHDCLISYITFLLDLEDVVRLSCCSRILRVFACEEPLWLGLCLKQEEGIIEYRVNWRQTALATYTTKTVPAAAVEAAARPLSPLPGLSSLFLYKRWYRCHVDLTSFLPPSGAPTVDRVPAADMSPADFFNQYDKPSIPVLLGGLMHSWPVSSWSLPALSAAFSSALFKVSKPHGGRALMTLPAYADYMARQTDEEPLYIFDPTFTEAAPGIRKLYDIPHVFTKDYYSELGAARPNFRWLVLGPARAGASWHVDPALTSAWNALLSGRKRWALYPPHVAPPGVNLDDDGEEAHTSDDGLTSLQWFLEVYPTLPPEIRPIEFVQNPGDVVFVPGGWWHCVLNLETSVAVTQNYVGPANLTRVISYMADGSSTYHAAPLPYYDTVNEVAVWSEKYPYLTAPGGEQVGPMNTSESSDEVAVTAEEEEVEEEEEEEGGQQQRRNECGLPKRRCKEKEVEEEEEEEENRGVGGGLKKVHEAVVRRRRRRNKKSKRAPGEGVPAGQRPSRGGRSGGGGGGGRRQPDRGVDVRSILEKEAEGGQGSCEGALVSSNCATAANGSANGNSTNVRGLPRNRSCGTIAAAVADAHADLHVSDGGNDVYCGDDVTGSDSRVRNGREVASVSWRGELEYEEVAVWRRDRILGRWLRRLWMSHPSTRPTIQDCLFRHLHAHFWRTVLRIIVNQQALEPFTADREDSAAMAVAAVSYACSSGCRNSLIGAGNSGSCSPQPPSEATPLELIPLTGADALVFLYGGTAIKIFLHEVPAMRGLMCALELRVPQLLLPEAHVSGTGLSAAAVAVSRGCGCGDDPITERMATSRSFSRSLLPQLPQPLAWGTVAVALTRRRPLGEEEKEADLGGEEEEEKRGERRQGQLQQLLYVVQRELQGSCVLQELLDSELSQHHLIAIAWELGHLLGEIHASAAVKAAVAATTAPAAVAVASTAALRVEDWDQIVRERAVWHNRYHNIWVSGLGCVSSAPDDEDEGSGSGIGGGSGSGGGASGDGGGGGDAASSSPPGSSYADEGWRCNVPVASPWWPFVKHLRTRKRRLLRHLPGLSLPAWVKDQVPAYLPEDPAELLGFGAEVPSPASASAVVAAPPPLLLHGDVTAHNVIVAQPPPPQPHAANFTAAADGSADGCNSWHPQLSLVDFADSGHGDPLYELLPVIASCLCCDTKAAATFWACYCRHVDPSHVWPKRSLPVPPGADANRSVQDRLSLSYCAMCYCLLHEEAELLLQRLWRGHSTAVAARGGSENGATAEAAVALGGAKVGLLDSREAAGQKTLEGWAARLWGFLDE